MMNVYMLVTADEMELPVFVSDSLDDMSAELDIPIASLRDAYHKGYRLHRKYRLLQVEIDETPPPNFEEEERRRSLKTKDDIARSVAEYINTQRASGKKVSIKSACAKYNINPHTYTRWTRVLNDDRAIT